MVRLGSIRRIRPQLAHDAPQRRSGMIGSARADGEAPLSRIGHPPAARDIQTELTSCFVAPRQCLSTQEACRRRKYTCLGCALRPFPVASQGRREHCTSTLPAFFRPTFCWTCPNDEYRLDGDAHAVIDSAEVRCERALHDETAFLAARSRECGPICRSHAGNALQKLHLLPRPSVRPPVRHSSTPLTSRQ
jgi:hypothetical protein